LRELERLTRRWLRYYDRAWSKVKRDLGAVAQRAGEGLADQFGVSGEAGVVLRRRRGVPAAEPVLQLHGQQLAQQHRAPRLRRLAQVGLDPGAVAGPPGGLEAVARLLDPQRQLRRPGARVTG
jgi:hypothetical protein